MAYGSCRKIQSVFVDYEKRTSSQWRLASLLDKNKEKFKPIISSIILCAVHDLLLRGKTDEYAVFNELLKFREESGDLTLSEHLKKCTQNATYILHRTQNEIINICATVLRHEIIENIKYNEIFSILIDETMDFSGTEQLPLCGKRYFNKKDKCIMEDFLGFTPLEHGSDAGHVADVYNVDIHNLEVESEQCCVTGLWWRL